LVRPIGLDVAEVGGSNPPGPTKIKNPPLGGFFGFGGVGLDESRCSTNATNGAFGPPQHREGAAGFNRQRQFPLASVAGVDFLCTWSHFNAYAAQCGDNK